MSYKKSREELFSYFNKHSAEKKDELDRHKTRSPLLKSYIIETSSVNQKKDFFDEINNHYDLSELKGDIIEIDDDQEDDKPTAWIESFSDRYFIFYSTRTTEIIENKLMKVIQNSPLLDNYSYLNKLLEEKSWLKQEKHNFQSSGYTIKGSPVIIEFEKSLELTVFKNFIYKIFQQRNKNFRLWGEPLKISEKKYHVYGLDLHLWKEVFLELTPDLFVLILPEGVCGNTINRFITNIQTFLEPNFDVYIGDESYEEFLEKSFLEGGLKYA